MNETAISIIRTYVPIGVGALATFLARTLDVEIDTAATATAVTAVASAVWYGLVRLLEKRWPQFGWLLGAPKQPSY